MGKRNKPSLEFEAPLLERGERVVGIDEACSGIRSFQASLMISLFLGEYYSLVRLRRVLCVLAGFALALLLNLARLSVLAWVAASQGGTGFNNPDNNIYIPLSSMQQLD